MFASCAPTVALGEPTLIAELALRVYNPIRSPARANDIILPAFKSFVAQGPNDPKRSESIHIESTSRTSHDLPWRLLQRAASAQYCADTNVRLIARRTSARDEGIRIYVANLDSRTRQGRPRPVSGGNRDRLFAISDEFATANAMPTRLG